MTAPFTPGPWIRHSRMAWVSAAADPDGAPVCKLCMKSNGVDREHEALANGLLIAASPTMFDYIAKRAAGGDTEAAAILEAIDAGH